MFILYAVLIGLVVGLLLGGRLAGLGEIKFRLAWVMIGGLPIQVLLFSDPVTARIGALGRAALRRGRPALVVAAVLRNRDIIGMPIVAIRGGLQPRRDRGQRRLHAGLAERLSRRWGSRADSDYSNSTVVPAPELGGVDRSFALPQWLPFANVFSFGDVLIAIGIVVVFVVAMRSPAAQQLDHSLSPT